MSDQTRELGFISLRDSGIKPTVTTFEFTFKKNTKNNNTSSENIIGEKFVRDVIVKIASRMEYEPENIHFRIIFCPHNGPNTREYNKRAAVADRWIIETHNHLEAIISLFDALVKENLLNPYKNILKAFGTPESYFTKQNAADMLLSDTTNIDKIVDIVFEEMGNVGKVFILEKIGSTISLPTPITYEA